MIKSEIQRIDYAIDDRSGSYLSDMLNPFLVLLREYAEAEDISNFSCACRRLLEKKGDYQEESMEAASKILISRYLPKVVPNFGLYASRYNCVSQWKDAMKAKLTDETALRFVLDQIASQVKNSA